MKYIKEYFNPIKDHKENRLPNVGDYVICTKEYLEKKSLEDAVKKYNL